MQVSDANHEAGVVGRFLRKLLRSTEALKMKYMFNPNHVLKLDLTDSGFPNQIEIGGLSVDLSNRDSSIADLPSKPILKRTILDIMMKDHVDPVDDLHRMGLRTYYEMLNEDNFFFPFTPGEIVLEKEKEKYRSYIYSWACWDFSTNRPYIHVMTLHQDIDCDPLENGGVAFDDFIKVIKDEGSRAPDVGILAMVIDDALDTIHPKAIKRICIGPLYSRFLMKTKSVEGIDYCNEALAQAMIDCNLDDDDFVLLMEDDIVFSKGSKKTKGGLLSLGSKVREVFCILETDPTCYKKRASMVHKVAFMPHVLCQYLNDEDRMKASGLEGFKIATYNDKEVIHGS
jgi:hypothetical protein